ncbi:MAG: DUF2459 domain-containing protein [Desulfobulbaceae bacterium]|nr:DUF2459 domain-containing protein [Desulfobulbaceae bacterium]
MTCNIFACTALFSGGIQRRACRTFLLLLLCTLAGCAASPLHPDQVPCRDPRTVYAVNHGRHVGLVVAAADLAAVLPLLAGNLRQEEYAEIGWGDLHYYQEEDPTLALGFRALFLRTDSVLHFAAFSSEPELYFAELEVLPLQVENAGYRELLEVVAGSFARTDDGSVIEIGPGLYGRSRFYQARGDFHIFNTCNTWVARVLRATGYPLSSRTITSTSLLNQLRTISPNLCFPADPVRRDQK